MTRIPGLRAFIDATESAIAEVECSADAKRTASKVFSRLRNGRGRVRLSGGGTLNVCSHLDHALNLGRDGRQVSRVADALRMIEPWLVWTRRANADPDLQGFYDGHANAMIVGPGGLELRDDVWIGVTLMAPGVTYVEHEHPPEEVYLALTPGEWWNADMPWIEPGIGGIVYNPPGIRHTMRSNSEPLLAIWCLPI